MLRSLRWLLPNLELDQPKHRRPSLSLLWRARVFVWRSPVLVDDGERDVIRMIGTSRPLGSPRLNRWPFRSTEKTCAFRAQRRLNSAIVSVPDGAALGLSNLYIYTYNYLPVSPWAYRLRESCAPFAGHGHPPKPAGNGRNLAFEEA
jgi:hypothetical protein